MILPHENRNIKNPKITNKNNAERNPFPIVLDNQTIARPDIISTTSYMSFQHQHLVINDLKPFSFKILLVVISLEILNR